MIQLPTSTYLILMTLPLPEVNNEEPEEAGEPEQLSDEDFADTPDLPDDTIADFGLPDFDATSLPNINNEEPEEAGEPEQLSDEDFADNTDLPDDTVADFGLPDFDDTSLPEVNNEEPEEAGEFEQLSDENFADNADLPDDTIADFDLPDNEDDNAIFKDPIKVEDDNTDNSYEETQDSNDIFSDEDDLPDFDNISTEQDMTDDEFFNMDGINTDKPDDFDSSSYEDNLDDFPQTSSYSQDSLSLPDFPEDENQILDMPDDFFDDLNDSPSFSSSKKSSSAPLSFTGLYDKETEMGMSGLQNDEIRKKTKAPVVICVICAIICLIATGLVFYAKYMKNNPAENQNTDDTAINEIVLETPEKDRKITVIEEDKKPDEVPEVPEAKEDEIVIIEQAEKVVPAQPEIAKEKPDNITYTVTWGDTLWDIANTYYKNPWKYKDIVEYNNIKNPDYIISGTRITIPAE